VTTTRTWTILELINWSKDYLAEKGFENARLETELLLGHVLSLPRIELYLQYERQLNGQELAGYKVLLKRRMAGEPVQYVTGTAGFMLADFEVTPDVLIPRPETEALVEVAVGMLGELPDGAILADIGTGSGVIAVTLAQKFPGARVIATDASAEALAVAARNAERVGGSERITFVEGAGTGPLAELGLAAQLAGIVSNPPYIPSADIEHLDAEVSEHEPRIALDGGPDGLDLVRVIVDDGCTFIKTGGVLALEFGDGQADSVRQLLDGRMDEIAIRKDYAGRERIATARAR